MAYNLEERFPKVKKCYRIFEPGTYQHVSSKIVKPNVVPFLTNAPRKTQAGIKLWTHAMYCPIYGNHIQNCTAFKSKKPRFSYKAFSEEEMKEILCKCGIESICECQVEKKEDEFVCQSKVHRRIFKGPTPRTSFASSKKNSGLNLKSDGPVFYDTRVNESTAFYRGWKWRKWTSSRSIKCSEVRPGPADYDLTRPLTENACLEKIRSMRRKNSKQLRYIEMVQNQNLRENRPGPASYDPSQPSGTELQYYGPKTPRFSKSKCDERPGPTDYCLKRDFDLPRVLEEPCRAKLPQPACFGVKTARFKYCPVLGPSPASYDASYKQCKLLHCSKAGFNSSAARFKSENIEDDYIAFENNECDDEHVTVPCVLPTWQFRSRNKRLKPLMKIYNEPSPADMAQTAIKVGNKSKYVQFLAPFATSGGRFHPWHGYIPVNGQTKTPGPCYYNLEKPKCNPAVRQWPLFRSPRFKPNLIDTPASNEYQIGNSMESVLDTHNTRLKNNIEKKHKFLWNPPSHEQKLHNLDTESELLENAMLTVEEGRRLFEKRKSSTVSEKPAINNVKPKMLRCFLYRKQIPVY